MHLKKGIVGVTVGFFLYLGACVPPQGGMYGSQPGQPGQPGQGDPNLAGSPTGGASCASTCQKTLQCLNAYTEADQASCATNCQQGNPPQQRLDHIQSLSCQDLIAFLKSEQQQKGAAGGAQPAGKACTAELCQGCVGDGTNCYHGTNLPCDPCCCAPGGPSPVWR